MPGWKKKDSREIASSTIFTMVEDDVLLPDGNTESYTIIDFPDFAAVLPIYEDKFVFIRNYRYPIDKQVLEIPAGLIDQGETPEDAAIRELEEETGYILEKPEKLCTYHPMASLNTQLAHLYVGHVKKGGDINHDPAEDMETMIIPITEAYGLLDKGELLHPHTMIALFFARDRFENILGSNKR